MELCSAAARAFAAMPARNKTVGERAAELQQPDDDDDDDDDDD